MKTYVIIEDMFSGEFKVYSLGDTMFLVSACLTLEIAQGVVDTLNKLG